MLLLLLCCLFRVAVAELSPWGQAGHRAGQTSGQGLALLRLVLDNCEPGACCGLPARSSAKPLNL